MVSSKSNILNYSQVPTKQNKHLKELGAPHVDSFNYAVDEGLPEALKSLMPITFTLKNGKKIRIEIQRVDIHIPTKTDSNSMKVSKLYPKEARLRGCTYDAPLDITFGWSEDGVAQPLVKMEVGRVPIMLKSRKCNLSQLKPAELIERNEHACEWGGYFIVGGNERLIRMLIQTRRNYPIALKRSTWKDRGTLFSDIGVQMRCVKQDQTAKNNVLHFVTDGTAKLMFTHRKMIFFAPVMLIMKALLDCSDEHIFNHIMSGFQDNLYFKSCVLSMIQLLYSEKIVTHKDAQEYLGAAFKVKFSYDLPTLETNVDVCDFILRECICPHAESYFDKFQCLVFMLQKLFSVVQNDSLKDSVDGPMMQELLLGGHLYLQALKDKLQSLLYIIKENIVKRDNPKYNLNPLELRSSISKCNKYIELRMKTLIGTGNLTSLDNLGLQQSTGLSVNPENINRMRYMSHFRAVHRGAYFSEMRTTDVRQLLPEAWGFICPVHTPDGAPCGLLNHLSKSCKVSPMPNERLVENLLGVLLSLGMEAVTSTPFRRKPKSHYSVLLDGRVVGFLAVEISIDLINKLRVKKVLGEEVPRTLEIVLIEYKEMKGASQFPGLFLFTSPARMMRPVKHLALNKEELIGTFEQVYMDIAICPEEMYPGRTTHMELSKTHFLSNLANLIPMPDCNQSPRNMYQCQMGKQTMGTPCHNFHRRDNTKLYRLQTPGSPFFKTSFYDELQMDDFPMGTNAIVAVVSYTGYDMEDAMVLNKQSVERGFAYGSLLMSEVIELKNVSSAFERDPKREMLAEFLDIDGLPYPGARLLKGNPLYCYFDAKTQNYAVGYLKAKDEIYVENVRVTIDTNEQAKQLNILKASITYRVPRAPSVGDKFASRAGQKGICSYLWASEDLPFTESGLVPDIVFNPHGFPSRMTIAMMIEMMAGKSAALHGMKYDATPFKFNEENTAIDYFGKLLEAGGFNYYGTERMYSGTNGREMKASIFFGIVHYQRLRHMVADKWQVRSTGPIDSLTRQPIKGRKKGGGVRFGEMERDSLLSHGAAYLLQDRLFLNSDRTTVIVCSKCGSLIGPVITRSEIIKDHSETQIKCSLCKDSSHIRNMEVPYILKYLIAELSSVNIYIHLKTSDVCKAV
ncbi:unnamed protein product [Bemisia tabaci]|uniref:DNA-directed RNA polymerase subunit beta n=1 Tax=Bemisia tabaci TaxID=7038 RepID=A0A9P0F1S6_BEMTA|nr:unnamed protein product [Bemisia tabaci]